MHFVLLFFIYGLVDWLLTDLNIGIFLHLNGEEDSLFLDPKYRIDAAVWALYQGNPSAGSRKIFCLRTGLQAAFPSSCHLQPICNRLQPELFSMVKNQLFDGFTPIFTDF
jgi:hypothetical protein